MYSSFGLSFNMVGTTTASSGGWDFTPSTSANLGALWCTTTIDFTHHFTLDFDANFNILSNGGADGICTVFGTNINTTAGTGSIGWWGGYLGYYSSNPDFAQSLALEIDDFNNGSGYFNDTWAGHDADHVAVVENAVPTPLPGGGPALINGTTGIKDGNWHHYEIEFCPAQNYLYIYVWNNPIPILIVPFNPVTFWGTSANAVSWGFTGADANSFSNQIVRNIAINNPVVAPIVGPDYLCVGSTGNYTDATTGGTWSSTSPLVTVNASTGDVTATASGTAIITYTASCDLTSVYKTITICDIPTPSIVVNPSPTSSMCVGDISYIYATPGGSTGTVNWISSDPTIATVTTASTGGAISSGLITAVSPGTVTITYSFTNSCGCTGYAYFIVTVYPHPGPIGGVLTVCTGSTTTLIDAVSPGVWTSSDPTVALVLPGGVIEGMSAGTAIITYNAGTATTPCFTTAVITVCETPEAKIDVNPSPSAYMCVGDVSNISASPGGSTGAVSWASSNPSIASVVMIITGGGTSTATITANSPGIATITYTITTPCGCTSSAFFTLTVNPVPAPITGPTLLCVHSNGVLTDAVPGGVWSSSNISVLAVAPSGAIHGVSPGTAIVTYSLFGAGPTPCYVTYNVTVCALPDVKIVVNPSPTPVLCVGDYTLISGTPGGGTWTSGNPSVAIVNLISTTGSMSTASITAISPGTATITYTVTGDCGCIGRAFFTVTVYPTVAAISGASTICAGAAYSTTFTDLTPGGIWTCSPSTVATITPAGVLTGISGGTAIVTYQMGAATGTTSCSSTRIVTVIPQLTACVTDGYGIDPATGDATNQLFTFTATTLSGTPVTSGVSVTWEAVDCSGSVITSTITPSTLPFSIAWTSIASTLGRPICQICVTSVTDLSSGCTWPVFCCVSTTDEWRMANPTGVTHESITVDNLSVTPNPNKGEFTIKGSVTGITTTKQLDLEIVDMLGQVVYKDAVSINNGELNKNIILGNNIANGVYFVRVKNDQVSKVLRFSLDR